MKNYETKVDKLHVKAGSKVSWSEKTDKDVGRSGKLLCSVPGGGSLFYAEDELEEIKE